MRERHHDIFGRDQVLGAQVLGVGHDLALALVAESLLHLGKLLLDDLGDARRLRQHVEQIDDLVHRLPVLGHDLVLLQRGQVLQPHLEDALRLDVREPVASLLEAEFSRQPLGPGSLPRAAREQVLDQLRAPETSHQLALGLGRCRRALDKRDHVVHIR